MKIDVLTKKELKTYLRKNLKVRVTHSQVIEKKKALYANEDEFTKNGVWYVQLFLEGEEISKSNGIIIE